MKILVVNDAAQMVKLVTAELRKAGLDADGIVPMSRDIETPNGRSLKEETVLEMVRNADVIFLDHSMPFMDGDELLAYWKEKGIDFANKRVVGISCSLAADAQPYVKERFRNINSVVAVKRFLGL